MASSTKAHHPFDFHAKISKKVAELTVVVHMLFKRNHEKEVEYEYFKMVAEQEMNKIKEQHQQKIEWLEKQLDEQEAYRAKVEYQLGDMNDLKEKISQLEQANENTKQQVKTKEELLSVANLEIDVLKQKIQSYEEDVEGMKIKPQEAKPPDKPLLRTPGDQERISKSATQLNVPSQLPEKRTEEMEAMIKRLEDEIAELKRKHENEITKSYTEKMGLQKKIDGYTSSLSQEIDELKQTLNILSSKQVDDQKKLAEVDKEKKRVEENLKKSEAEKKQLQRDAKILRDQLKNAIKNNHITKKNLLAFRDAISQGGPKQRLFDSVSKLMIWIEIQKLSMLKKNIIFFFLI